MSGDFVVEVGDTSPTVLQKNEYVRFIQGAQERVMWLHDYDEIYKIQGLYEAIFIDLFKGVSHQVVPDALVDCMTSGHRDLAQERVLDFGAGVGLAGERLAQRGVGDMIAIDVTHQGRLATLRDRPQVYAQYLVEDMSRPSEMAAEALRAFAPTALICVSSLNVIPVDAWTTVYDAIPVGGLVAFNVLSGALATRPEQAFLNGSNALVRHLMQADLLEVCSEKPYRHRLNSAGQPVMYTAVVGRKRRHLSLEEARRFSCPSW